MGDRPTIYHVLAVITIIGFAHAAPAGAQPIYHLDGIPARQVQPVREIVTLEAEWSALQRQLKERSRPTDLKEALEWGLLNNPQLAAAYAQIQGQQWNLIAVQRQWFPTLNANSLPGLPQQSWRSSTTSLGAPLNRDQRSATNETTLNLGLNISWTFFDPSRGPAIHAAKENLKQQQLLFDVSARNLVLRIQDAYFNLQEQQELIRSYQEILIGTTRQVKLTEEQFNSGLVSIADVEQIRTQQYSTLTTLLATTRQLIAASAAVAEVMALPPGTLVTPKEPLSPLGSWEDTLPSTIDQALMLREEIQASLAAAASANWSATSLFNTYWPRFSIAANGTNRLSNSSGTFAGINQNVSQSSTYWDGGVGVGFTWQFFDGGIAAAQAETQRAGARSATDQAAERRLSVTREVEESYATYLTSRMSLQSTRLQAESARAAAVAIQERFSVGVTDMATVVQSLNQAITAASNYAAAIRAYNASVASLFRTSARWPESTWPLLKQRVDRLRQR